MAKAWTNLIIEERKSDETLLMVWSPTLVPVMGVIEAIEGVSRVFHDKAMGRLNVYLNPCYQKHELIAEIKAAVEGLDPLCEEAT